jgi:mannitol-1-phosphate 5-dehydrogenase
MRALVFGAGNIGRGFLGVLLHQAGYAVTFADIDAGKVVLLNQHREYPVYVCARTGITEQIVTGVDAVSVQNTEAITAAICNADIILTAVGKAALAGIATVLAKGLVERAKRRPSCDLSVIVIACENVQDNTSYLANLTFREIPNEYRKKLEMVSFPDCIVDRIVPTVLPASVQPHPLAVAVEDYFQFVVDANQLRTAFPSIEGVQVVPGVSAKLEQKLFTLNMAHGITGY